MTSQNWCFRQTAAPSTELAVGEGQDNSKPTKAALTLESKAPLHIKLALLAALVAQNVKTQCRR